MREAGLRQRKEEIQKIDRDRVLARCEEKYPMVAEAEYGNGPSRERFTPVSSM